MVAGGGIEGSIVGLLASLIPMYVTGLMGNEWRAKSMLKDVIGDIIR